MTRQEPFVRLLDSSDAEMYKQIRLRSLKENPEAFLTTFEIEQEKSIEMIRQRLQLSDHKFTLGAFDENHQLAGIVTFVREANPKLQHKGNVYAMYVVPELREQGIGKTLLLKLIERARGIAGLERINLAVVSNNSAAKKLYRSMGFKVFGTERNALKSDGQYWDEDWMTLQLL